MREIPAEYKVALESARRLCDALEQGLPKGETPETVGEFIEVHLRELAAIKQTIGKNVLMLRLTSLGWQISGECDNNVMKKYLDGCVMTNILLA